MSRPTLEQQRDKAEEWMRHSFGMGMADYLTAKQNEGHALAVVEVARLMSKSKVNAMLERWRAADAKSAAGQKPLFTAAATLTLILLQVRLKQPTLLSSITDTYHKLSNAQRAVLKLPVDVHQHRSYDRIQRAVQRLIALVDEFPGRRDKILSESEYRAVVAARDPAKCSVRRTRMFEMANELLEATWRLLPAEIQERAIGNVAIDATRIPLLGKAGNPAARVLDGDRRTTNYDGGYYGKDGNHGAYSKQDARALNKKGAGRKVKGSATSKLEWAVELEVTRMVPNHPGEEALFPLMTLAVSFHIPGAIAGEGFAQVQSMLERGHKINYLIVDRAYPNGLFRQFHVPLRTAGAKLVFDYKGDKLGVQAYDERGFVQVSGAWYLDNLPNVHREADTVILQARDAYANRAPGIAKRNQARRALEQAEELYAQQLEERRRYLLKPKGRMSPDGARRYLVPDPSTDGKARVVAPHRFQNQTVAMEMPPMPSTPRELETDSNAGGLKHEQYLQYGTPEWRSIYGMRNGVESVNRGIKSGQFEDLDSADKRAVRGNTFTYIAAVIATVSENLRRVLSFYQEHLAMQRIDNKVRNVPTIYWQRTEVASLTELGLLPPG